MTNDTSTAAGARSAHPPTRDGTGGEQMRPAGLLMHAARGFRRRSATALAPWSISPHQARALRVVAVHGPLRSAVLADWLRIAPRSATEVVDALVQRGLVQREPDPQDRRAVLVGITEAGAQLRQELEAARAAAAEEFFAPLDPGEREVLVGLLARLVDEGDTGRGGEH